MFNKQACTISRLPWRVFVRLRAYICKEQDIYKYVIEITLTRRDAQRVANKKCRVCWNFYVTPQICDPLLTSSSLIHFCWASHQRTNTASRFCSVFSHLMMSSANELAALPPNIDCKESYKKRKYCHLTSPNRMLRSWQLSLHIIVVVVPQYR